MANRARKASYGVQYYARHADHHKKVVRAWQDTHPGHIQAKRHRRRASVVGTFTLAQWREVCERFDYRCAYCFARTRLTVVAMANDGANTIDNVVPACSKGTKPLAVWLHG